MSDDEYYKDKICIITGANSGIGYELTKGLLEKGAIVYMAGRSKEKVEKAAQKLSQYKDRIHTVVVDVTIGEEVQKLVENTADEEGRLDFLFNNAGIYSGVNSFDKATLDDLKTIIDTNIWSVIYGVNAAVPIMLKQGFGHIVNTASLAGLVPYPFQAIYNLTKFTVAGFTESLRYEYKELGINFSTICPGNVATPLFEKSLDGTVIPDPEIPDDAIPVTQASKQILEQLPEENGIIVVPEDLRIFWQGYACGKVEDFLLGIAEERRESLEKRL